MACYRPLHWLIDSILILNALLEVRFEAYLGLFVFCCY